jgi:hypothetical protein
MCDADEGQKDQDYHQGKIGSSIGPWTGLRLMFRSIVWFIHSGNAMEQYERKTTHTKADTNTALGLCPPSLILEDIDTRGCLENEYCSVHFHDTETSPLLQYIIQYYSTKLLGSSST